MRQGFFIFFACSLAFSAMVWFFLFAGGKQQEAELQQPTSEPRFEMPKTVRDVTPEELLQGPQIDDEPLERLPALEPPEPPKKPPKPVRWTRPVVISAGVIKSGDKTLTLPHVKPLALDETCESDNGDPWPCGMLARTEMRLFVRGRPLSCAALTPEERDKTEVSVPCTLDGFDLSAWLVLTGWAQPIGDRFQDELSEAKAKERGIWR